MAFEHFFFPLAFICGEFETKKKVHVFSNNRFDRYTYIEDTIIYNVCSATIEFLVAWMSFRRILASR